MTSPSSASFHGGPLDGTTYERRQDRKFVPRLHLEVNGVVHVYVALVERDTVVYRHVGVAALEVIA